MDFFAQGFTVESFQGNYAFQATLGPKVIFLGAGTADGYGNISATGTGTFPALFGEREVIKGRCEGTLEVNPDGTGVMPHTRTFEGINTRLFACVADFVIMEAEVKWSRTRKNGHSAVVDGGMNARTIR